MTNVLVGDATSPNLRRNPLAASPSFLGADQYH
jgi:hypothetical protein